jgi:histone-lysine N-methyltransferase SETMAR
MVKASFSQIVTEDETLIHHFEPDTKRQSMEWRHPIYPRRKKFKVTPSAAKVMATVFYAEGVILVQIMPRGQTINSNLYIQTLKNLQKYLRRVRPHKNVAEILLQHDNERPHTSLKTQEAVTELGWTVLPHPLYSPDLAPSDLHLFGTLKDAIRRKRFGSDDKGIEELAASAGFRLVQDGDTCSCFLLAQGC